MPKAKTEGAGLLSKPEKVKLQCTEMEKPHMDQLKTYKRQVGYQKRKLLNICMVKTLVQSVVMQNDFSKDYQHLLNKSTRSGFSIGTNE